MIKPLCHRLAIADCLPRELRDLFTEFPPERNSRIETGEGIQIVLRTEDFQLRFSPSRAAMAIADRHSSECGAVTIAKTLRPVVLASLLDIAGLPSIGDTIADINNRYCVLSRNIGADSITFNLSGIDIPGFFSVPVSRIVSQFMKV